MIVSFAYPSSHHRTGGVTMLYEFANALARRGHEVHFIHGPVWDERVASIDEIPFRFEPEIVHHLVDALDDPSLPRADVYFGANAPHLGEPAAFIQGFRLLAPKWDAEVYRSPTPKLCVASWLVDVGRAYGVPERQLVHIPLGLDHDTFAMRTPPTERSIDVAMLYHPSPAKGWEVARRVLDTLLARRPGLRATVFTLAVPHPELPAGVELVSLEQRALADEVFNRTKVLVQASYHEGFGLTALEAMACGAALVTTDCGGSRDYASPGETALVVRAGDVDALTDSVEQLLDDEQERIALAERGAKSVSKFDWEISGKLLEEFLDEYITDPAAFQKSPGEDHSADFEL
jgi:glycosyltransferase involved in cell wall biosynthesis